MREVRVQRESRNDRGWIGEMEVLALALDRGFLRGSPVEVSAGGGFARLWAATHATFSRSTALWPSPTAPRTTGTAWKRGAEPYKTEMPMDMP